MLPALFLDRDGVIIENRANYVRSWADVELFPTALQALAQIAGIPHKIFIVTNQSMVGRGLVSLAEAQAINTKLVQIIHEHGGRIDGVYLCPHAPKDKCACRKPLPGLLQQAQVDHHIDLANSIMIGDALTDVMAGENAGISQNILLLTGRGKVQSQLPQAKTLTYHTHPTLAHALPHLF
jgi:D-glycero-D-manno-heptose 1,7-bisphosphate phosphatase